MPFLHPQESTINPTDPDVAVVVLLGTPLLFDLSPVMATEGLKTLAKVVKAFLSLCLNQRIIA